MNCKAKCVIVDLSVKKLRRVSPSRYISIRACLLREIWNSCGHQVLLPSSPVAEMGKVIHRLLEAAGRGQLKEETASEVDKAWTQLVGESEKTMASSWLTRQLVPLCRSIRDFEVRKIRACKKALEIALEAANVCVSRGVKSISHSSFELWVETEDMTVGGYIDHVKETPKGVIISDYKSGLILEDTSKRGSRVLKEAFRIQLELYAALYWCTFGKWAIGLEVVPLQGDAVKLNYLPEEAAKLLADARVLLDKSNAKTEKVLRGICEKAALASPGGKNCRVCLFRPGCEAYWSDRKRNSDEKWPYDIRGEVTGKNILRNGRLCLQVAEESKPAEVSNIRNISNSQQRHPALSTVQVGNRIAIFGLKYLHRTGDYSEKENTVIYN